MLTVVNIKIMVSWDVMLCSLVERSLNMEVTGSSCYVSTCLKTTTYHSPEETMTKQRAEVKKETEYRESTYRYKSSAYGKTKKE